MRMEDAVTLTRFMLYNRFIYFESVGQNAIFVENQINMGGVGSGGACEGAGRKATNGARAKISARVPVRLVDLIKDEAARRKVSTSQLITEFLTKGLER